MNEWLVASTVLVGALGVCGLVAARSEPVGGLVALEEATLARVLQ
jgi:hypothetical protein